MTETIKATPGPWEWDKPMSNYKHLISDNGTYVLSSDEYAGSAWIEIDNEADARLIAAAPELLEALKAIMRHGEMANIDKGGPHWSGGKKPPTMDAWAFPRHMLTSIEEAIAKAEQP